MFYNAFQFTKLFEYKKEKKQLKIFNNFISKKLISVCNDEILQLILKKCLVRNIQLEIFKENKSFFARDIFRRKKKLRKFIYF